MKKSGVNEKYWHSGSESGVRAMSHATIFSLSALIFVIISLFIAATANAEEYVKLEDLIKVAIENNPKIKSAKLQWGKMLQKYPQAVSLDDPVVKYSYPVEKMNVDYEIMVSQKFPLPGKLGLEGKMKLQDADIAKNLYDKVVRDTIVEVKKSFYELYYLDNAIILTEKNKKVMEHFTDIGTTDYASDATSLNDVLKAQSQYAQVSYDLILLKEMRSAEMTKLNTILNNDPEYLIGTPESPIVKTFDYSVEELYKMASENEEIKVAEAKIKREKIGVSAAKYKYFPEFELGLQYKDITKTSKDEMMVSLGVKIPLWFSKSSAVNKEARLNLEKSIQEKSAVNNDVRNKVKNTYFKIVNSDRLVKLYESSLIPQAKKSMEIAETWYKQGEGSFSGVLETQSIWFNFQLAYYRALSDYLKNISEMEKATGGALY